MTKQQILDLINALPADFTDKLWDDIHNHVVDLVHSHVANLAPQDLVSMLSSTPPKKAPRTKPNATVDLDTWTPRVSDVITSEPATLNELVTAISTNLGADVDSTMVSSTLRKLVKSGDVVKTGRGKGTRYHATNDSNVFALMETIEALVEADGPDGQPLTKEDIASALAEQGDYDDREVVVALMRLVEQNRLVFDATGNSPTYGPRLR